MRGPIERALGACDVALTAGPKHATQLAHDAARAGRETVIALGGDGTISEVVSGLMAAGGQTRLGVIGYGTGGDLRRTLGLEHRLDRYLAAIAGGVTRPIDVGRYTATDAQGAAFTGYFVNVLSVGLGGLVDRHVTTAPRALGGTAAYALAALRGLAESEVIPLIATFSLAGETREAVLATRSVAICNGRFFGGGMQIAPMASCTDGVFEVIDLGASSRLGFAHMASGLYTGAHLSQPDVRHWRCERLTLRLSAPSLTARFGADRLGLDIDGEPLGQLPLTIEVVPAAIEVYVP